MFLKKLTDEELDRVKKSKKAANKSIKIQLWPRSQYSFITGLPVVLKKKDDSIVMDYTLLKKIDSSLRKSKFWRISLVIVYGQNKNSLVINYLADTRKGAMVISELPSYQVELLSDLPVINLKE